MKTIQAFAIIAFLIILSSCEKEEISYNSMSAFFEANTKESQFFNINANQDINIIGKEGTIIKLTGGSYKDKNDQPISGEIVVELKELYSKSDLILSNKPTITKDGKLLESGGVIYLNILKDNKTITGDVAIMFPTKLAKENMRLFSGVSSDSSSFAWETIVYWDAAFTGYKGISCYIDTLNFTPETYNTIVDSIFNLDISNTNTSNKQSLYYTNQIMINTNYSWINCDKFIYNDIEAQVSCNILDKKNDFDYSLFFIVDSINSVIDINTTQSIPVGYKGKILAIGVNQKETNYYLKDIIIKEDIIIEIELEDIKAEDLLAKIKSLN